MKYIVTGGAGFIGSHLVDRLVAMGNEVSVIDDLSVGKITNVNRKAIFSKRDVMRHYSLDASILRSDIDAVFQPYLFKVDIVFFFEVYVADHRFRLEKGGKVEELFQAFYGCSSQFRVRRPGSQIKKGCVHRDGNIRVVESLRDIPEFLSFEFIQNETIETDFGIDPLFQD